MNQKRSKGFSLLEVLLAVVVITIAGIGTYSLFDSGVSSNNISDATNEAVEVANVYTDLASSNLTADVTAENIVSYLQNTGRLSNKYFSTSTTSKDKEATASMNNAFGRLDFTVATPYSFVVAIPLGCLSKNSSVPEQFFKKVEDAYSCDDTGSKDFTTCAVSACSHGTPSTLTLYFNLNN